MLDKAGALKDAATGTDGKARTGSDGKTGLDPKPGHGPDAQTGYGADAKTGYGADAKTGYGPDAKTGYGPDAKTGYGADAKTGYGADAKTAYSADAKTGYGVDAKTGPGMEPKDGYGTDVKVAYVADGKKPYGTEGKAATSAEPAPKASTRPQTRKARLRLARLDPWSVMKTAFLLSIAFGIVVWVAVFIVWSAIGAAGVFENINNTVTEVLGTPAAEPFRIENYINTGKVMGFTTLLACADVLIITALATLGSFLYNIAATLLGGLEVTLASED